jgi:hypothetical protein
MSNENVVKNFFNGSELDKRTINVYISQSGCLLRNYNTTLAQRVNSRYYIVNLTRYSCSSAKIQSYVKFYAKEKKNIGCKVIYVYNVPMGTWDLISYASK